MSPHSGRNARGCSRPNKCDLFIGRVSVCEGAVTTLALVLPTQIEQLLVREFVETYCTVAERAVGGCGALPEPEATVWYAPTFQALLGLGFAFLVSPAVVSLHRALPALVHELVRLVPAPTVGAVSACRNEGV